MRAGIAANLPFSYLNAMADREHHLAEAERHVREGEARVARQLVLFRKLEGWWPPMKLLLRANF